MRNAGHFPVLPPAFDEQTLGRGVLEILQRHFGADVQIEQISRRPFEHTTLFPAEVLEIQIKNQKPLRLFAKRADKSHAGHPDKRYPYRELRVYEQLLNDPSLPTIRYFGTVSDEAHESRILIFEFIDDWRLEYQEYDHWFSAARRLGNLHAYFGKEQSKLAGCDFLLRLDGEYLRFWASEALRVVAGQSLELAAKLEPVVNNYDHVVQVFGRQTVSLVHNDLAPQNVLIDRRLTPARVGFIDWEMAGIGFCLMDLVRLKYGTDPLTGERMCRAYFEGLDEFGWNPFRGRNLEAEFAACELHKTMYLIAHSRFSGSSPELVAHWVAELSRFSNIVLARQ